MDITQSKGNANEMQSMLRFISDGYDCSVPFGNCAKYDFIVDINGHLYRMQNKCSKHPIRSDNGNEDIGSLIIHCVAQTTNTQKTVKHRYDKSQIDYFTTTFEGKTYVIPVEECSDTKTIRLTIPENGITNYNWYEDYLYENVIERLADGCYVSLDKDEQIRRNRERKEKTLKKSRPLTDLEIESHIKNRKVVRPGKETLFQMINEHSFMEVARMFCVTDNAIRKWCKSYGIPSNKRDLK